MRRISWSLRYGYIKFSRPRVISAERTSKLALGQQRCRTLATDSAEIYNSTLKEAHFSSLATSNHEQSASTREEILTRAANNGIENETRLAFESNLRRTDDIGSRLVDTPPYRNDLNLWKVLLDYQIFQNGIEGAKTIFRGMKYRGTKVTLYSDDPLTNNIWLKLLSIAAEEERSQLIFLLCEVNGIAWKRQRLFAEVIGILLKHKRDWLAANFLHKLRGHSSRGRDSVIDLYRIYRPEDQEELRRFFKLYSTLPVASIYAETVPKLWEQGRSTDAFLLHQFLISRNDLPDNFEQIEPFLLHLARQNEDPGPFLRRLMERGASFYNQSLRTYGKEQSRTVGMSPETLNIVASYTFGYKPKKLSDSFVARALATKALSFDFVLSALQVLGLIEVGPQSIREMGLSAPDLQTLQHRFERLTELGIDTGSSAYGRFIKTLVSGGQSFLLTQALQTDMHHEVFADKNLQRALLAKAQAKSDWAKVDLLLSMLNDGLVDKRSQTFALDLLLRSAANHEDWRSVLITMNQMLTVKNESTQWNAVPHVTRQTLRLLISKALFPSDHTVLNIRPNLDPPRFVIGILQDFMAARVHVPLLEWREPLRELGKRCAFEDVERQVIWLASWYQPQGLNEDILREPVKGQDADLNLLFSAAFLQALIHWGFKNSFERNTSRLSSSWKRSLDLVKHLQDEYGVEVNFPSIQKAVIFRLQSGLRFQARSSTPVLSTQDVGDFLKDFYSLWDKEMPEDVLRKVLEGASKKRKSATSHVSPKRMARLSHNADELIHNAASHQSKNGEESQAVQYTDFFHPAAEEYSKKYKPMVEKTNRHP